MQKQQPLKQQQKKQKQKQNADQPNPQQQSDGFQALQGRKVPGRVAAPGTVIENAYRFRTKAGNDFQGFHVASTIGQTPRFFAFVFVVFLRKPSPSPTRRLLLPTTGRIGRLGLNHTASNPANQPHSTSE
jgi:hypothetical protein